VYRSTVLTLILIVGMTAAAVAAQSFFILWTGKCYHDEKSKILLKKEKSVVQASLSDMDMPIGQTS